MARIKETGENQVEGTIRLYLDLVPEDGDALRISNGKTLLPLQLMATVHLEEQAWVVGSVVVKGTVYRVDGSLGTRWSDAMFAGPLDDEFEGPDWVAPLLQREIATRLGGGVEPTDRQIYDLSIRTHSNLGMEGFREVLVDVLGPRSSASRTKLELDPVKAAALRKAMASLLEGGEA